MFPQSKQNYDEKSATLAPSTHFISVSTLEQRLEKKFNRGFSYRYIAKLADKTMRQAFIEADRTKIEERLAFTR